MLHPVNKQIVVKLPKKAAVSAGGIHLPESSTTEDVVEGIVIVGARGTFAVPDRTIVFPKHAARPYRYNGTEVWIVPEEQVLAYIDNT